MLHNLSKTKASGSGTGSNLRYAAKLAVAHASRVMRLTHLPPEAHATEGRLHAHSRTMWQQDTESISEMQRAGRWLAHDWQQELPEIMM